MTTKRKRTPDTWGGVVLALVVGLAVGGCDTLLDVSNPGSVEEEELNDPGMATTLVNSALGRFECAYTSYVASSGMLAEEYWNASGFLALNPWGWRGVELYTHAGTCPGSRTSNTLGAYTPLQEARFLAEEAMRLIEDFPDEELPDKTEMLGQLSAYAGYSYILLGEGFCESAVDQGEALTPEETLELGRQRLESALSYAEAADLEDLRLLALAGRARIRLNLGELEGAAADAAEIPEGWRWDAEYSTIDPSRENRLYNLNHHAQTVSVNPVDYGPEEGNATLNGEHDPRLPMEDAGDTGHDGETQLWLQLKYPSPDSPIPMASWEEAQLIIAEADEESAEEAINRLRAAQDLPAYEASDDILEDVLEERRRQLFSEGHRLNDMLRHDIPFPEGTNHKGQSYGPITCMPLPDQERDNNPNIGS